MIFDISEISEEGSPTPDAIWDLAEKLAVAESRWLEFSREYVAWPSTQLKGQRAALAALLEDVEIEYAMAAKIYPAKEDGSHDSRSVANKKTQDRMRIR